MAHPAVKYEEKEFYTVEEYLAMEEVAEYKSEYSGGKIYAMAGGSISHDYLCKNLYVMLHQGLKGGSCDYFTGNMKLGINKIDKYYYPDSMIICGELIHAFGKKDTLTNAKVIFEVLSDSTENKDRGEKFHSYWKLDSMQEYVLISQHEAQVEVFRRLDEQTFQLRIYRDLDENIPLESMNMTLSMKDLYEKVIFEEKDTPKIQE